MNMSDPNAGVASRRHILVVENETVIAMVMAMQLRNLGYEPLGPAGNLAKPFTEYELRTVMVAVLAEV